MDAKFVITVLMLFIPVLASIAAIYDGNVTSTIGLMLLSLIGVILVLNYTQKDERKNKRGNSHTKQD